MEEDSADDVRRRVRRALLPLTGMPEAPAPSHEVKQNLDQAMAALRPTLNQFATFTDGGRYWHSGRHLLPDWLCDRLGHPLWAHPGSRALKRQLEEAARRRT